MDYKDGPDEDADMGVEKEPQYARPKFDGSS